MLSTLGVRRAKLFGEYHLRNQLTPTHLICTPYTRTLQTLAALIEGHGQIVAAQFICSPLLAHFRTEWGRIYATHGSDLAAIRELMPDFIAEESATMAGHLGNIVRGLPDGARALIVGHAPGIELAVLGLADRVIRPCAELEGVQLEFEDSDSVRIVREIRLAPLSIQGI